MNYQLSATNWVVRLADGDERAIETMFAKYFDRLIRLAARKMVGLNQAPRSSEDVAVSAVKSFCAGLKDKRWVFESEDDLWARLFIITTRKACAERRRAYAAKRGKNAQFRPTEGADDEETDFFQQVAGREPSPELALELAELADSLLALFDDRPEQRRIVELKLRGFSTKEIAAETGLVERTVVYHLSNIQETWTFLKNGEYLIENAFDGIGVDELAESVGLPSEKIRSFFERALDLWRAESRDATGAELLRLKLFESEQYAERRAVGGEAFERFEETLGRTCDLWKARLRGDWKTELRRALK